MSGRISSMLLAAGLACMVLMPACRKEPQTSTWDVDVVAPLIKTTLTLADLVPDSMLSADAQGNLSILYTDELFSLSLDTVLTAPDTSFQYAYVLPVPGPVSFPPGTVFNTNNDVTQFDLEDLALSELRIRSGQVDITIISKVNGTITGDFALPGATLNGAPFIVQLNVPPGTPDQPSFTTATRALDGYVFDMTGPDHNSVNTLATQLTYATAADGPPTSITDQDSLIAVVRYYDIVPQYATGSFGTRLITVDPDTTELDLFANVSGILDLDEVSATLLVHNGIGVDARANIQYLRSVNTTTGNSVDLQHAITQGPVNLDRAIDLGNNFQPALNSFLLNADNSNIEAFMENLPDRVEYAMEVTVNPLGDISNGHDFLYHESRLSADLSVDIPLRLIATDLTLQKIIDVDLPGSSEAHALQSGTLHLFSSNGFPFSASIELAVVDAQDQLLAILAPGGTIPSGLLGNDGFVSAPTDGQVDIEITPSQMDLIQSNGRLRLTAVFNTADQSQHVQLLSSYQLGLQLTIDANYVVNGDE